MMVAKELLTRLSEPFEIEGHSIAITASMALAFSRRRDRLCRVDPSSRQRMYAVKRSGGNGVRCYTPDLG